MKTSFDIPILFLVFNRPDTTKAVFEVVRKVRPTKLYIVCDGARDDKDGESALVDEVRSIFDQVDWECTVHRLFRESNLGCGQSVSGGIDWFFDQEEMGIILEDDCLPSVSFFGFCQSMLLKFKEDDRVMHISGNNLQFGKKWGDGSFYYSRLSNIWGWATWRRAWKKFNYEIPTYPKFVNQKEIANILPHGDHGFIKMFIRAYEKRGDWGYQWSYALLVNNGLAVTPNVNLISNIGFGGGTNSVIVDKRLANQPLQELSEIVNPTFMIPNIKADKHFVKVTVPSTIRLVYGVWKKGQFWPTLRRKMGI